MSPVRWTAGELGQLMWEGIEQYGCFDLRLTGPASSRGRGADVASFAAEEARKKGISHLTPARVMFVRLVLDYQKKKLEIEVTAGVVEETGTVLVATRFDRASSTSQKAVRIEMKRIAMEIAKRFSKAVK
jgi:hypothetical protein